MSVNRIVVYEHLSNLLSNKEREREECKITNTRTTYVTSKQRIYIYISLKAIISSVDYIIVVVITKKQNRNVRDLQIIL